MTIPNTNEVDEVLNQIAGEMARLNARVDEINIQTKPLTDEKATLADHIKELDDWLTEEMKYAHSREADSYEVYQKVKAMWDKFRADTRQLKLDKEQGAGTRIKEIETELWDSKLELRNLQSELDSLQRKWDQAQRLKKDAENYASVEERLSQATIGAPWREWAKDHQIVGGKRIAFRGRMILADTMGLGKTLTSIVACDLIRAMTASADEEHPVVIETN